jgi:hypothetical protein
MGVSNYERFKAFFQTQSFWNGSLAGIQSFHLSQLDFGHLKEDAHLELPHIPPSTVLGKRAEHFFKFCIKQSSNYNLIASNVQIIEGKKTLGEIDYLVEEIATGTLLHIELVYKFYCYKPSSDQSSAYIPEDLAPELSRYVGPNLRDNFVLKFDRLAGHQLPLLQHPVTKKILSLDPERTIQQRVCFLAHVFIPTLYWDHTYRFINTKSIVGDYCSLSTFKKHSTHYTYYLPEKFAWKMKPHAYGEAYTHDELIPLLEKRLEKGYASMIWVKQEGIFKRRFITSFDS